MIFHPFKGNKLIIDGHGRFHILLCVRFALRFRFRRFVCIVLRFLGRSRCIAEIHELKIRHSDLRPAKPARVVEDNTEFSTRMKRFLGVRRFPYPARAGMLAQYGFSYAPLKDGKRHPDQVAFIVRHRRGGGRRKHNRFRFSQRREQQHDGRDDSACERQQQDRPQPGDEAEQYDDAEQGQRLIRYMSLFALVHTLDIFLSRKLRTGCRCGSRC